MSENEPKPASPDSPTILQKIGHYCSLIIVAMIEGRPEPWYNVAIYQDGKSLKDLALHSWGYRHDSDGNLEKIPPTR